MVGMYNNGCPEADHVGLEDKIDGLRGLALALLLEARAKFKKCREDGGVFGVSVNHTARWYEASAMRHAAKRMLIYLRNR